MKTLIGIPTLNGPDRLKRALFAVHEFTDMKDVQVLVSDDCSNQNNLEWNKTWCGRFGVSMLMTEQRLGIAKQWNRIVRHVPDANIVALINDDIEVVPHWLDVLRFTLEHNPEISMVGLRCETGVTASRGSRAVNIDYVESRLFDGSGSLLSSGGACFAFRRTDWEMVGGFDERFFCFYEELDFGVQLGLRNKQSVIAEYPVVYHMGGATIGANSDAGAILTESRAKFWEKYALTLDQLRAQFFEKFKGRSRFVEWNSQRQNWRLP